MYVFHLVQLYPLIAQLSCSVVSSLFLLVSSGNHKQKFYFGRKEIMLPVYKDLAEAVRRHPSVNVMINFASLRSAYDSTMEALGLPQVKVTIATGYVS